MMNEKIKTVVITGVTGQDGSFMVEYLLEHTPHNIYGVYRRSATPNLCNLKNVLDNPRFKLIVGDLSDSQSINDIVSTYIPDYFINFAAQSFVGASWDIPEQTFDVDALGVIRCLNSIRKYAPKCHFYNAGSTEQFGDVITVPQTETHPFRPRSPYGAAKCAAHHIVKVYRESYNLYAVQGILSNHESERRGKEFVTRKITLGVAKIYHAISLASLTSENPIEKIKPIELGNLDAKRDWTYTPDFIDGVWKMLNQEEYNQELKAKLESIKDETLYWNLLIENLNEYLLSSDETHSVREFVELAFKEINIDGIWINDNLNTKFIWARHPNVVLVKINPKYYRPAEVSLLMGDSSKARAEIGWQKKHTFEQLVKIMVQNDIKK